MKKWLSKQMVKQQAKIMDKADTARITSQEPTADVKVHKDIPYMSDGKKEHLLDIYYPEGASSELPVIIDIHGGGLFYGYKEINQYYNMYIASKGYIVFSINYTLIPNTTFDEQLREVHEAFNWIMKHGRSYPSNMDRIFINGDSAGALLTLYATAINNSGLYQDVFGISGSIPEIKGLGLVSGMFYPTGNDKLGKLLEPLLFKDGDKKHMMQFMDPESLIDVCDMPPMYLVTSVEDFIGSYTEQLIKSIKRKGIQYQYRYWPKGETESLPHVFSVTHPLRKESKETIEEMLAFFESL